MQLDLSPNSIKLTDGQKIVFAGNDARTKLNEDAGWIAKLETAPLAGYSSGVALKSIRNRQVGLKRRETLTRFENPAYQELSFLGLSTEPMDTLSIESMPGTYSITGEGYALDKNFTRLKSSVSNVFDVGLYSVDSLYLDEYNGKIYFADPNSANYTTSSHSPTTAFRMRSRLSL